MVGHICFTIMEVKLVYEYLDKLKATKALTRGPVTLLAMLTSRTLELVVHMNQQSFLTLAESNGT